MPGSVGGVYDDDISHMRDCPHSSPTAQSSCPSLGPWAAYSFQQRNHLPSHRFEIKKKERERIQRINYKILSLLSLWMKKEMKKVFFCQTSQWRHRVSFVISLSFWCLGLVLFSFSSLSFSLSLYRISRIVLLLPHPLPLKTVALQMRNATDTWAMWIVWKNMTATSPYSLLMSTAMRGWRVVMSSGWSVWQLCFPLVGPSPLPLRMSPKVKAVLGSLRKYSMWENEAQGEGGQKTERIHILLWITKWSFIFLSLSLSIHLEAIK